MTEQVRYKGIRKGILEDQQAALAACGFPDFDIHLVIVTAEIDGVLIFFVQILVEIQRVIRLAVQAHPVRCRQGCPRRLHAILRQRRQQHLGIQRAVKIIRKHRRRKLRIRRSRRDHDPAARALRRFSVCGVIPARVIRKQILGSRLQESRISEIRAVAAPMVVGTEKYAAVRALTRRAAVFFRRPQIFTQIDQPGAKRVLRLRKGTFFVKAHRMVRQVLLIDIGRRRYQHRVEPAAVCLAAFRKLRHLLQVSAITIPVKIRLRHTLDHSAIRRQIHAVDIADAQGRLGRRHRPYPEAAADDLVVQIVLGLRFKAPAQHILHRQLRCRLQIAVLVLRKADLRRHQRPDT